MLERTHLMSASYKTSEPDNITLHFMVMKKYSKLVQLYSFLSAFLITKVKRNLKKQTNIALKVCRYIAAVHFK